MPPAQGWPEKAVDGLRTLPHGKLPRMVIVLVLTALYPDGNH